MRSVSARVLSQAPEPSHADRWYPIAAEIEYKTIRCGKNLVVGHGLTLGMSRAEIMFKLGVPVDRGSFLEVWVDWPARLEGRVALQLYAQGEVRESQYGYAVLQMFRYDYRTARQA